MNYVVKQNETVVADTDWPPLAEAAWHRATRDQSAGGIVRLFKGGVLTSAHRVVGGRGAKWPDGHETGLRDVVKAILQVLRSDGWDAKEIAEAMTAYGLSTSRSRVDALRGAKGHSAELSHAEIVVLLNAVISEYKRVDE